jgi:adenine-specific DNA methylase
MRASGARAVYLGALLPGEADQTLLSEFAPDSTVEEAVRSEPVSKMDFRNNARFRGVYSTVTGGKGLV